MSYDQPSLPRPTPIAYNTEKLQAVDLTEEIAILRKQLRRLDELYPSATTLAEKIEISRVIAQTPSALSRLTRAQVYVFSADTDSSPSEADQLVESWKTAIELYLKEVGL